MQTTSLNIQKRTELGKGPAGRLRREGRIPATIYGRDIEPISISVDPDVLRKTMEENPYRRNTIFELEVDGKTMQAVLREYQKEPVSLRLTHVDFVTVDADRSMNFEIPIVTVGKSIGVKLGGVLDQTRRTLKVNCAPKDLPENIKIDITDMNVDDKFTVGDLEKKDGVTYLLRDNTPLVFVRSTRAAAGTGEDEEGEEGEETAEGAAASEEKAE